MPPKRQPRLRRKGAKRGSKAAADPTLLRSILQAIVDLRQSNGSTEKQIVHQIEAIYIASKRRSKPKQLSNSIKQALDFAVHQGVLIRKQGKYKLAAGLQSCRPIRRMRGKVARRPTGPKSAKKIPRRSRSQRRIGQRRVSGRQKGRPRGKPVNQNKGNKGNKQPAKKPPVGGFPRNFFGRQNKPDNSTTAPPTKRRVVTKKKNVRGKGRQRKSTPGPQQNAAFSDTEQTEASLVSTAGASTRSNSRVRVPYRRVTRVTRPKAKGAKKRMDNAANKLNNSVVDVSDNSEYDACNHGEDVRCNNPNCLCNFQERTNNFNEDVDSQDVEM